MCPTPSLEGERALSDILTTGILKIIDMIVEDFKGKGLEI
jgi:hypothetical protein